MQKTFVSLLVILVVLGAIGAASYYWLGSPEDIGVREPEGRIYLSLYPNDISSPQDIYYYDFETKSLERFYINELNIEKYHKFNSAFSPDGSTFVFSMEEPERLRYTQLFTISAEGEDLKQITDSPYGKKDPDWSPDGSLVAYIGAPNGATLKEIEAQEDGARPESWNVHITDLEGNERLVASGVYPKFSPDGQHLVVLKDDGLYRYDVSGPDSGGERVWEMVDGGAYAGMKLGLSEDRNWLAWGVPNIGEVIIARVDSWEPFRFSIVDIISTHAFWPVFSPDGNFIAAEEVDWQEGNENPRLIVYDLNSGEKRIVLDLSEYQQTAMWINDWR